MLWQLNNGSGHTQDELGESHRTVSEIARHLGLSVARVDRAVTHNRAIVRSDGHSDQVSVWRQEPQSVYDNHELVDILLR